MKHHALEEINECLTLLGCDRSRMARRRPKGRLIRRETIVFELDRLPFGIGTHEQEVTEIRDENLPVPLPVFRYLGAVGRQKGVVAGRLRLDDAARRLRPRQRFLGGGFLELIGREKADIGDAGAMARVDDASDLGLQSCADSIQ